MNTAGIVSTEIKYATTLRSTHKNDDLSCSSLSAAVAAMIFRRHVLSDKSLVVISFAQYLPWYGGYHGGYHGGYAQTRRSYP